MGAEQSIAKRHYQINKSQHTIVFNKKFANKVKGKDKTKKTSLDLFDAVRESIIGDKAAFDGPFGTKNIVYCDHVASGRSLKFIEEYMQNKVYPFYANTHTTTSICSQQISTFRNEARQIIKTCVNAGPDDVCIFTGSGATSAIHKLVNAMDVSKSDGSFAVIVGPYEHHSNILPWKEAGAKLCRAKENSDGLVDLKDLDRLLSKLSVDYKTIVASFSAASNVTGILSDTVKISEIVHEYGAYAVFDYACGAPYLKIDMNPEGKGYKDAVFCSPHKFVGGPQTPGILIAKKGLFRNHIPHNAGGGTVLYVTKQTYEYLDDIEEREEGGTPAILESIRAGLIFQLKDALTEDAIIEREMYLKDKALKIWLKNRNIHILGNCALDRLPIFSFLIRHPETGLFLHHNFISTLLNDLYGIQARGGCACAGPYAQDLLSIDNALAEKLVAFLTCKRDEHDAVLNTKQTMEIMKPGFTRLNLAFFFDEQTVQYVINAVDRIASYGWMLLPFYKYDVHSGNWSHRFRGPQKLSSLLNVIYNFKKKVIREEMENKLDVIVKGDIPFEIMTAEAECYFQFATQLTENLDLSEDPSVEKFLSSADIELVWFLEPKEALRRLQNLDDSKKLNSKSSPLFNVKRATLVEKKKAFRKSLRMSQNPHELWNLTLQQTKDSSSVFEEPHCKSDEDGSKSD
ncbi:DgyrCDS1333 [Dimorphilus gyrociliatus]|uniref:DgyrCDS1333 n=1 Tax=Dimorphilus gyrociliatus TaxID=2664684 RepID=A0A7I8V9V5_9ANNE|nr:DgyrCDS1333 [Dimorphilus gyrociliatus]